jgi:hypothetical protein
MTRFKINDQADEHSISWLVDHLKSLLPSHETMLDTLADGGIGPSVKVPAVHLHILLSAFAVERLTAKRARMTFGSQIAAIAGPSEWTRAYAIRSCATAIVDGLLDSMTDETRKACIRNVEAKIQLLPLAPLAPAEPGQGDAA